MLDEKDRRDVVLKTEGKLGETSNILLETKFTDVKVRSVKSFSGVDELWIEVTTKSAFEVAFLKKQKMKLKL